MKWYEGDIAEAVALSKTKNAVFVVFVAGKDEQSKDLTTLINNSEVSSTLESEAFVSIQIDAQSVAYSQFAVIYKMVPVPSLFFIGKNGKPVDIIANNITLEELTKRINIVIEQHTGVTPTTSQENIAVRASQDLIQSEQISQVVTAPTPKSQDLIQSEQNSPVVTAPTPESTSTVKCENSVCPLVTDVKSSTSNETIIVEYETAINSIASEISTSEVDKKLLTPEEQVQHAKGLIEEKRKIKEEEEKENEKKKEIERRKMGQDVQKMRRWQQDQELKNMMEERQRARTEEKVARDRILAQIAQDKADRAARFGTSPPAGTQNQEPGVVPNRPSASVNTNTAMLQFRLPDGTNKTHDFDSTCTLEEVRSFLVQNLNLPYRFTLSTTFPRREFTADNNQDTLRELELCPNAVILVIPGHTAGAISSTQGGGFMSLIWLLLSPVLGFFGYFRNLIFGAPVAESSNSATERKKRSSGSDSDTQPTPPNKRKATDSTVVRRQGYTNIHRLTDRTDSDEDNNTWNGNSTQQM